MKALFVLAAVTSVSAVLAQDAKPQLRGSGPAPMQEGAAAPATKPAANEGIGLIPETLEPAPKPKGGAIPEWEKPEQSDKPDRTQKIDKTTAAEDEMNAKIRFRELKTLAEKDPKVSAEWDHSNRAKSDYERREALKAYYTALYDKVAKLDPKLQKRAVETREKLIHRLVQTRIAPTEPIETADRADR